MTDDVTRLREQLDEGSRETLETARREQQEADDRSTVTRTVMAVFSTATLGSLAVLFLAGLLGAGWPVIGPLVVDLMKSVILPVVLVVVGFYFGRSGKG